MPARRLIDVYNAKVQSTQLSGAVGLSVQHGYRRARADNDGTPGVTVQNRDVFYAQGVLRCQDIRQLMTVLAAFEGNITRTIQAEGKEVGSITAAAKCVVQRAKLTGARVSFTAGQYASCDYSFRSSCAAASNTADDEVTWTDLTKTVTHASAGRIYRVKSAVLGGALTPLGVDGLDLNINGNAQATWGDDDFGETVEVPSYDVTGTLRFKDTTIATLETIGQRLQEAAMAALVLTLRPESGSDVVVTLANLLFHDDDTGLSARGYGQVGVDFSCQFLNGTTEYALASGSNKVVTVA